MQKDILKKTGILVSIGAGNTRIKAKIYSKLNKPFGIYIGHTQEQEVDLYKKLPLKDIPYIGRAYQERFKYSCKTIYDFISLGFWTIKKEIGKNGTDLWLELVGVNSFVVKKSQDVKSIGRSRSFNKQITSNHDFLKEQILLNFNRVYEEICNKNYEVKTINVMLRDKEFKSYALEYKFSEYTNIRKNILKMVLDLFEQSYNSDRMYRSTGVVLANFRSYLPKQTSIFDKPLRSKENEYILTKTVNRINEKYGSNKLSFGMALLGKGKEAKLGIRK